MPGITRWFTVICGLLVFACAAFGQKVSPAVQVGINYGPGKSLMISGVIVGDGGMVLTQANVLRGAAEIVVALTNEDVLDASVFRIDQTQNVALLKLEKIASAAPPMLESMPPGDVTATAVGAPEAFKVSRTVVQLQPEETGGDWRVTPALKPAFRGAPVLSISGTLLGVVVERAGAVDRAIPITRLREFIAGEAPQNSSEKAKTTPGRESAASADLRKPQSQGAEKPKQTAEPEQKPSETEKTKPAEPAITEKQAAEAQAKKPAAAETNKARPLEAKNADTPETNKQAEANKAAAPEVNKPPGAETKKTAGKSVQQADAPDAQRREIAAAASRPAPVVTEKKEPEKQPETRTAQIEGAAQAPGAERVADAAAGLSPVEQWKQRITAEPQNAELRFAFADALVTGGLYDDAIKLLLKAADDFPSNAQVYWRLGQAYWQQGFHKPDGTPRAGMERTAYHNCVGALETFVARAGAGEANVPQAQSLLAVLRQAKK